MFIVMGHKIFLAKMNVHQHLSWLIHPEPVYTLMGHTFPVCTLNCDVIHIYIEREERLVQLLDIKKKKHNNNNIKLLQHNIKRIESNQNESEISTFIHFWNKFNGQSWTKTKQNRLAKWVLSTIWIHSIHRPIWNWTLLLDIPPSRCIFEGQWESPGCAVVPVCTQAETFHKVMRYSAFFPFLASTSWYHTCIIWSYLCRGFWLCRVSFWL